MPGGSSLSVILARATCAPAFCAAAILSIPAVAAAAPGPLVLRVALNADILSTNPGVLRDENTDAVLLHVAEGLVAPRHDGSIAPMLARSWRVSADGRSYTFTLRHGVTFHNGASMTSADVVWSLQRYLSAATHWRCLSEFTDRGVGRIVGIAAPDPYTVTVTLDRPAPLFLSTLARPDCGQTAMPERSVQRSMKCDSRSFRTTPRRSRRCCGAAWTSSTASIPRSCLSS